MKNNSKVRREQRKASAKIRQEKFDKLSVEEKNARNKNRSYK